GGDYYDVFLAPDGRVAVAMGDVCGSGVEAATKTSMIKYAIRGMVAAGAGPAQVLSQLNDMIVAAGDPSGIVTVWLGFVDMRSGDVTWANGGHPPALLFDPRTRRIDRLGTTGALLGAVADALYAEHVAGIAPQGILLLFTDGVTEARRGGRFFGEGRVRRALSAGGSAAAVTQRLLSSVQHFAGGELRDDAAILTLVRSIEDEGVRLQ
ncbi:MAG: PP2C family protein-serine/threonine phosphatase, partial [Coriobacteriales bacterium]